MPACSAVKADGQVCGKEIGEEDTLCALHRRVYRKNGGPQKMAIKELGYKHALELKTLEGTADADSLEELKRKQEAEMKALTEAQEESKRIKREERERIRREEQERHEQAARAAAEAARRVIEQVVRANPVRHETLADIATDRQNTHSPPMIAHMKSIALKILDVPVPELYRWNTFVCSKTPADIIATCNLHPHAAWQMMVRYCQQDDVYELGPGTYGRLLDSVWQYVQSSPHREDLCKIITQELQESIGMCTQGCVNRVCNVLAGYMDGLEQKESIADILGRQLPLLRAIEDQNERMAKALHLFKQVDLPPNQWETWADPLIDEGHLVVHMNEEGMITRIYVEK